MILVVSATDRGLWQGPKEEVRKSWTSGFCAQPQKFETITVTIGYKNRQLLRVRVILASAIARSVALAKRIVALGTRMHVTHSRLHNTSHLHNCGSEELWETPRERSQNLAVWPSKNMFLSPSPKIKAAVLLDNIFLFPTNCPLYAHIFHA